MRVEIPNAITVTIGGLISRGVKAVEVTDGGRLVFTLTDGSTVDVGSVVGPQGEKGSTGAQGQRVKQARRVRRATPAHRVRRAAPAHRAQRATPANAARRGKPAHRVRGARLAQAFS